jgi:hypothetical protein
VYWQPAATCQCVAQFTALALCVLATGCHVPVCCTVHSRSCLCIGATWQCVAQFTALALATGCHMLVCCTVHSSECTRILNSSGGLVWGVTEAPPILCTRVWSPSLLSPHMLVDPSSIPYRGHGTSLIHLFRLVKQKNGELFLFYSLHTKRFRLTGVRLTMSRLTRVYCER